MLEGEWATSEVESKKIQYPAPTENRCCYACLPWMVVVYYAECSETGAVECCLQLRRSAHTNTHPHIHTLCHTHAQAQPTSFLPILEVTCIISCAPAGVFLRQKKSKKREIWSSAEHINVGLWAKLYWLPNTKHRKPTVSPSLAPSNNEKKLNASDEIKTFIEQKHI